jgi:small-conductance mechanosensitive channel/CRP-like cAMP-binding protein
MNVMVVWSQDLLLAGQALLLFFCLSILYWIVFKKVQWRSPLMQALIARVRLAAYMFAPLAPLVWLASHLARAPEGHSRAPSGFFVFRIGKYALLIVVAIFVVEACSAVIFDYLFAVRRKTETPQILRSLSRSIIYLSLFFVFLPHLFGLRDVAGLLTSSAIVSIILGLALQETLGNLFAGIGMQISRSYKVGDWIKIGQHEGIVERADWRSAAIRTLNGDQVFFPHSLLAKLEIQNYSLPSPLHAREVQIGVHYQHPPYQVEEILLRCARETSGVCAHPAPLVRLTMYQDFSVLYTVKFWIDDFARHTDIASDLLKRVWYHFKRADIQIPYPIRDVYHHKGGRFTDTVAETIAMLRGIEFLKALTEAQLHELARRLRTAIFARGETICRQGEQGDSFYIIKTGKVMVAARDEEGRMTLLRDMGAGEFFGEISLLTGEPRSATVTAVEDSQLLVVEKEDMRCMLGENSHLAEHISQVFALRQQQNEEQRQRTVEQSSQTNGAQQEKRVESLRREFMTRIVKFFSY